MTTFGQNAVKNVPFAGVDLRPSYFYSEPSIVDGMMRGLGGLPVFDPNGAPWEMCVFFRPQLNKGTQYVISEEDDSYTATRLMIANRMYGADRIGIELFSVTDGHRISLFSITAKENVPVGEYGAFKLSYDLKEYSFAVNKSGKWNEVGKKAVSHDIPPVKLCLCYHSNGGNCFDGEIDLNRSYITVGNKIWWEGVPGAHAKANMTQERTDGNKL